jgi:hypothetical protein
MSEDHQIVGESRGEPLPAGRVGVRVRLKLSGCPSGRWSSALGANLYRELLGHTAVGHLRLDEIVQGDEIILEGVEESEAPTLAATLRRAVDATNKMVASEADSTAKLAQERARRRRPPGRLRAWDLMTGVRSAANIAEPKPAVVPPRVRRPR